MRDLSAVQGRAAVLVGLRLDSNGSVTGDGSTGRPGAALPGRRAGRAGPALRQRHLVRGAGRLGHRGAAARRRGPGVASPGCAPRSSPASIRCPRSTGRVATGGRASARRALDALLPPAAVVVADPGRVARLQVRRAAKSRRVALRVTLDRARDGRHGAAVPRDDARAADRRRPGRHRDRRARPPRPRGVPPDPRAPPGAAARRPHRDVHRSRPPPGAARPRTPRRRGRGGGEHRRHRLPPPGDAPALRPESGWSRRPATVPGDPVAARIGAGLARLLAARALPATAVEGRLRALAAAATAAGAARLRPGGAVAAVSPSPRRIRGTAALARALDGPSRPAARRDRGGRSGGGGEPSALAGRGAAVAPALGRRRGARCARPPAGRRRARRGRDGAAWRRACGGSRPSG